MARIKLQINPLSSNAFAKLILKGRNHINVGIQKIDNKMCQFLHQLAGTENKNLKNAGSWELLKTKILSKGILWSPPPPAPSFLVSPCSLCIGGIYPSH